MIDKPSIYQSLYDIIMIYKRKNISGFEGTASPEIRSDEAMTSGFAHGLEHFNELFGIEFSLSV
jgi:hypothetical protein